MFTRIRVAAVVAALLVLVAATVFVTRTRADLHSARAGITTSEHNLDVLDTDLHTAVAQRTDARTQLAHAQAVLLHDTTARDQLLATNAVQYRLLTTAIATLAQHRSQLAAGAARAKLLDDCLIGASQVLNEAAVGDTAHLASTLPNAQQMCSAAAA
jgi:uncharacterized protein involved in exopolysaccharide biosynthesis